MLALLLGIMMTMLPGSGSIDTVNVGNPHMDGITVNGTAYDALAHDGRRRKTPTRVAREDTHLQHGRRTQLQANAQDLQRNYSIAGWMVRRHLDYVALFDFHSRNADARTLGLDRDTLRQLDRDIERLMLEDSKGEECDAGRRFSREKMFRVAEARRTLDGDTGLMLLNDGRMQGIEADCIRNPTEMDLRQRGFRGNGGSSEWIDGFRVGAAGRCFAAAVHRRGAGGTGYELQRIVSLQNLIVHGHYERYADSQTRGVSPITAALNSMRSTYEGVDMMLARLKVDQLFAMAVYRTAGDPIGDDFGDDDSDDEEAQDYGRTVNFSGGPQLLDLDPGDRAEFLSSSNPSQQAQNFLQATIGISLKALDIPYSFYDESFTNFFGSRAAWNHYDRSCIHKRADQITARTKYTRYKLRQWVRDGRLVLPAGVTIDDLAFEWVPLGMPWWDPAKEIRGDKEAVSAGFDNPQRISKARGHGDFSDNVRATCRAIADAREIAQEELGDPDAFKLDFHVYPDVILPAPNDEATE